MHNDIRYQISNRFLIIFPERNYFFPPKKCPNPEFTHLLLGLSYSGFSETQHAQIRHLLYVYMCVCMGRMCRSGRWLTKDWWIAWRSKWKVKKTIIHSLLKRFLFFIAIYLFPIHTFIFFQRCDAKLQAMHGCMQD